MSFEEMMRALAPASYVLLGETHDNPDHHVLQARVLSALVERGRRITVALEMLDVDQQPQLDAFLASRGGTADFATAATQWEKRGWPAFSMYEPIIAVALRHHLPIAATNLAHDAARAVVI